MSRFSLAPYTIRVKERATNQYIHLGNKTKAGFDILEMIRYYLENVIPSLPREPDDDQVIRRESSNLNNRSLSGILRGGGYGYSSSLLDVQADTISYERQLMDAELLPYYFLIKVPTTANAGIIIFQKIGNLGVKDLFFKDFNDYFKKNLIDHTLEIDPLVPTDLVRRYLNNRIVKIRLIKFGYPGDIADIDLSGLPVEEEGESEFILKAKKNGQFPAQIIQKLRSGIDEFLSSSELPVGSIIEIKDFKADNIKVEVRIGDSYRTVDLSNSDRLKFSEDISGRVVIDPTKGHPQFDSIQSLAESFLADCATAIWGGNLNA